MVSMKDSLLVTVQSTDLLKDGRTTGVKLPVLPHHSVKTMLQMSLAHLHPSAMCLIDSSALPQHLHVLQLSFTLIWVATRMA